MRCDDELRGRIQGNLDRFLVHEQGNHRHHSAAVAIAVVDEAYGADVTGLPRFDQWQARAAVILTRRSRQLRHHAGQWALPGGRSDAGESPEQTALRELAEEVSLVLDASRVLGRLDDFVTRSGFVITPVVVWAGPGVHLEPNRSEVESIHRIPVAEFQRADAPMLELIPHSQHPVLRMPVGSTWIAAPTAALLYQFSEVCVQGRDTRVAHYEQPRFAWR